MPRLSPSLKKRGDEREEGAMVSKAAQELIAEGWGAGMTAGITIGEARRFEKGAAREAAGT